MKTLYIVRHAKTELAMPGQKDRERPLKKKGIKRTEQVLVYLTRKEVKPDLIICSFAERAMHTAKLLAEGLGYPAEKIEIDKSIYSSDEDKVLEIIYGVKDEVNSLMLVGHNPTFTNLSNIFLETPIEWLPTTGIVSISFETSQWNKIYSAARTTNFYIYPKALK